MAKPIETKTNVMRVLDKAKIAYSTYEYPHEGQAIDGVTVAQLLGIDVDCVFKTLIARSSKSGALYVFCIPVAHELDLRKGAKAVGEKSIEMLQVKQLLACTGYVRGGCSPIGMKKALPTIVHESAQSLSTIVVSAGKIGHQVELSPQALLQLVHASMADVIL